MHIQCICEHIYMCGHCCGGVAPWLIFPLLVHESLVHASPFNVVNCVVLSFWLLCCMYMHACVWSFVGADSTEYVLHTCMLKELFCATCGGLLRNVNKILWHLLVWYLYCRCLCHKEKNCRVNNNTNGEALTLTFFQAICILYEECKPMNKTTAPKHTHVYTRTCTHTHMHIIN